ncbi:Pentatricopeptide repeat-containing protein At2g20710 mitochondrial [Euphorbia peplus]|nr:Pentatricopeptide repeat-containing protein At2g20710 mitochondrial [Euphorbia peplus]
MNFGRLMSSVSEIRSLGFGNLYSTKAKPIVRCLKLWQDSTIELYHRISSVGDWKTSMEPILDRWVEEGRSVNKKGLKAIISELRYYKRYTHALQISMWMTEKRDFELSPLDAIIRLELISKSQGTEQAEKYFDDLPHDQKGVQVYCALLKCYATAECVEKAEVIMQKMKDLGYIKKATEYNSMLNLYYKTGNMDKLDALLQDMEVNGIVRDRYTSSILFSAYASIMDVEKMDKMVRMMESKREFAYDWSNYTVIAAGYRKAGLLDKAFEMLKKAEACLTPNPKFPAYNSLLTEYATIGRKDEVIRVWSLYKNFIVFNQGYKCVLKSLAKLGDIETAEEIFDEWESQDRLAYDMIVPNIMIGAYSRKGLMEKAEAFIDRAISKGGKPNAWTWYYLVEGYLLTEQPQKAVEMMKKAFVISETGWKPDMVLFKACLEYLERAGDTEQTKEFANLLQPLQVYDTN